MNIFLVKFIIFIIVICSNCCIDLINGRVLVKRNSISNIEHKFDEDDSANNKPTNICMEMGTNDTAFLPPICILKCEPYNEFEGGFKLQFACSKLLINKHNAEMERNASVILEMIHDPPSNSNIFLNNEDRIGDDNEKPEDVCTELRIEFKQKMPKGCWTKCELYDKLEDGYQLEIVCSVPIIQREKDAILSPHLE